MTPVAPAGAKAPPPTTARRASASERAVPGRRRKLPGSPGRPVPRRVSGPGAAPSPRPRPEPGVRQVARPTTTRKQRLSERLAALVRSLPDHPLLDRVVRGRAWIPLLGVMLVGIVAMQVELLKLNADTGRSIELVGSLQSRNDILRVQVASASDPKRIERLASRMGMTMPGPEAITFLKARSASVRRALGRIHVPNPAAFEAALGVSNASAALPAANPSTNAPANSTSQTATAAPAATGAATTSTPTTTATGVATASRTSSSTGAQTSTQAAPPATVP